MSGCHVSDQNRYQYVLHIWTDSPEGTPGYLVWWWVGPTKYHMLIIIIIIIKKINQASGRKIIVIKNNQ